MILCLWLLSPFMIEMVSIKLEMMNTEEYNESNCKKWTMAKIMMAGPFILLKLKKYTRKYTAQNYDYEHRNHKKRA